MQSTELDQSNHIQLGSGRVAVGTFIGPNGYGVVMRDTGVEHKVGEVVHQGGPQQPLPGEIYIHCASRESALVLLEQVAIAVSYFTLANVPETEPR